MYKCIIIIFIYLYNYKKISINIYIYNVFLMIIYIYIELYVYTYMCIYIYIYLHITYIPCHWFMFWCMCKLTCWMICFGTWAPFAKVLEEASLMGRVLAFMSHQLSGSRSSRGVGDETWTDPGDIWTYGLVGGLVANFYFPIYWE